LTSITSLKVSETANTLDMKLKAVEFAQQWSNANKGK
jgi:hypothetical protein